jgi:tRNA(Ile)-lysidine synthase
VAERAAASAASLGLDPVLIRRVAVGSAGGPEAAARAARYGAFADALAETGATRVLLAHTLDDQAETVLLGLGRGSGPRSIAGMVEHREDGEGIWWRPLLGIRRTTARAACAAQELPVWDDPWNADPAYTRVRLRSEVLPLLEDVLGGGVAPALARTAALLRQDLDALDALAAAEFDRLEIDGSLPVTELAALADALRGRVLRTWLRKQSISDLQAVQLAAVDALLTRWHGQGPVALPGGAAVVRASGRLTLLPPPGPVPLPAGGAQAPTNPRSTTSE